MEHSVASGYMEHGFCFLWEPGLVYTHVISDVLTGVAYYAIAFAMGYFAYKRRDLPFITVFLFFALFILACGTTHFLAAYTVYVPAYWSEGYVKVLTMVVSVITAVLFIPKIPAALEMPDAARTLRKLQVVSAVQQRTEEELMLKVAELERFNYTLSHELKSPLVTVKSFLGFLEQDLAASDSQGIARDMTLMHDAMDRMKRMVDELLEMSRVGRVRNEQVSVHFGELVQEALTLAAGSIAARGITVKKNDVDVTLIGDRLRLVEIWQNLIENAAKYPGEQPAPCVEIGAVPGIDTPVFYVRDNGMGIDVRYHEKVFGLFDKLDPKSEGSGLGLALVKRIVELHKGRIWVESEGAGKGCCFKFTLPEAVTAMRNDE